MMVPCSKVASCESWLLAHQKTPAISLILQAQQAQLGAQPRSSMMMPWTHCSSRTAVAGLRRRKLRSALMAQCTSQETPRRQLRGTWISNAAAAASVKQTLPFRAQVGAWTLDMSWVCSDVCLSPFSKALLKFGSVTHRKDLAFAVPTPGRTRAVGSKYSQPRRTIGELISEDETDEKVETDVGSDLEMGKVRNFCQSAAFITGSYQQQFPWAGA